MKHRFKVIPYTNGEGYMVFDLQLKRPYRAFKDKKTACILNKQLNKKFPINEKLQNK